MDDDPPATPAGPPDQPRVQLDPALAGRLLDLLGELASALRPGHALGVLLPHWRATITTRALDSDQAATLTRWLQALSGDPELPAELRGSAGQ